MQNNRYSCSWRSKHQSEGTRKNHQIPGLEIAGAEIVECKSFSALGTASEVRTI